MVKAINNEHSKKLTIGLIGYGAVGKCIAEKLIARGFTVLVYDKDNDTKTYNTKIDGMRKCKDPISVIAPSDIIIGCTGTDLTFNESTLSFLQTTSSSKILISASSKDTEFNSLLRKIQEETKIAFSTPSDVLKTIHYKNHSGADITILKGGFPVNFDVNKEHSVSPEEIWPTRALLLASMMMYANHYYNDTESLNTAELLKLDPVLQLPIIKKYHEMNPKSTILNELRGWSDEKKIEYISDHSDGVSLKNNNQTILNNMKLK